MESDQAAVRTLLAERARKTHEKDARGTLGFYAEDIVNFDLAPPLAQRGQEATDPAGLQGWFNSWDGPINIDVDQVEIRTAGDIGFAFGFMHLRGRRTDATTTDVWFRFTIGLERREGKWTIVHEHQSFPTMMDGSEMSATHLRP